MELKCNRKELSEAIQIVGTVAASVTTQPVLQDIKVTVRGDYLELSATDLEVGIKYCVKDGVKIYRDGSIIVHGARISSILREWVGEEVKFIVEENICHIRGQDSYFKLLGGNLDMFPSIPDFSEEVGEKEAVSFTVRSEVFTEMIKKTSYAVATERMNQTLTGVLLAAEKDKIRMIATDGRRLAWIERDLEEPSIMPIAGIVPTKGLNHLLKVMSVSGSEMVRIQLKEAYLIVKTDRAVVSCRLIEGQYPKVEEVIPIDNDKKLELETGTFLSAVRRASLLTSEDSKVIRLHFEPNKLTLSSEATDLGEARIELGVPYTGDIFDVGFNPDFVIDALKVVTKEKITIELKQPNTAGIIRDGQGYLSLIMPINLLQE